MYKPLRETLPPPQWEACTGVRHLWDQVYTHHTRYIYIYICRWIVDRNSTDNGSHLNGSRSSLITKINEGSNQRIKWPECCPQHQMKYLSQSVPNVEKRMSPLYPDPQPILWRRARLFSPVSLNLDLSHESKGTWRMCFPLTGNNRRYMRQQQVTKLTLVSFLCSIVSPMWHHIFDSSSVWGSFLHRRFWIFPTAKRCVRKLSPWTSLSNLPTW